MFSEWNYSSIVIWNATMVLNKIKSIIYVNLLIPDSNTLEHCFGLSLTPSDFSTHERFLANAEKVDKYTASILRRSCRNGVQLSFTYQDLLPKFESAIGFLYFFHVQYWLNYDTILLSRSCEKQNPITLQSNRCARVSLEEGFLKKGASCDFWLYSDQFQYDGLS